MKNKQRISELDEQLAELKRQFDRYELEIADLRRRIAALVEPNRTSNHVSLPNGSAITSRYVSNG